MKNAHFFLTVLILLTLFAPLFSFTSFADSSSVTSQALLSDTIAQRNDSTVMQSVIVLQEKPDINVISWKHKLIETICAVASTLIYALTKKFFPAIFGGFLNTKGRDSSYR